MTIGNNIGIVLPPRKAKTRGGSDVRILMSLEHMIVGVYWSDSPKCPGWIPVRWSKLNPFYNGSSASGLDLLEDISNVQITKN